MLPRLIKENPACAEYLGAVQKIGLELKNMPLEEIETGYHKDGKLPKIPSGVCYHGKDVVVHPATVAAMAKIDLSTPQLREKAKEEITEVLGHLKEIEPKK